jgi:dCMP deaminase
MDAVVISKWIAGCARGKWSRATAPNAFFAIAFLYRFFKLRPMNAETQSLMDQVAHVAETMEGRPSWDEYFMATAMLISTRSPCERLHVGCVVVSGGDRKNRIVAAGYNGFLPGTPHVSRVREGHEQATVHAEQNAIADAARRGSSVEGCIAYVTHFPCINCAKILAASGIAEIRYRRDYSNDPLVAPLLLDAGVKILQL